ncbi:MAG: (Fe-S)-binding protein, partial [Acidobacteria bacterium]|nr:(Fe-S)-binding protein [Acidobacteriota bacterium]
MNFPSPAQATYWFISGHDLFLIMPTLGCALFAFIVYRRMLPLIRAQRDFRFDRPSVRIGRVLQYWLGQWKHPRYRFAGTIHILVFACFLLLATRAFTLLIIGVSPDFVPPGLSGKAGHAYDIVREYAATVVFLCMIVAAVRRLVFKPSRYAIPEQYGKRYAADAIFLLGLIALLMFADTLFEASQAAAQTQLHQPVEFLAAFSLPWVLKIALLSTSVPTLHGLYLGGYVLHEITFFFLLCYRPFGIQFHVETSLFSVYFAKLDKGTVKPVRWGVSDAQLREVKSVGIKKYEDFTWKHILDFYSCADCGRCSDQCPSNAAGRPLAPRMFTFKAREYSYKHYPVFGRMNHEVPLVGGVFSEDEIWSCTTCGVCEEECPLLIEYIDKIVDLRRGLMDDGNVPQSLQKPLKALESRGNPYGKMEKKRADWA